MPGSAAEDAFSAGTAEGDKPSVASATSEVPLVKAANEPAKAADEGASTNSSDLSRSCIVLSPLQAHQLHIYRFSKQNIVVTPTRYDSQENERKGRFVS